MYQPEQLKGGDNPESTDNVSVTHLEGVSMSVGPKRSSLLAARDAGRGSGSKSSLNMGECSIELPIFERPKASSAESATSERTGEGKLLFMPVVEEDSSWS